MRKNNDNNKKANNKIALGLIIGFMGGLLFDNLALGLIIGLIYGSIPPKKD